MIRPEQNNNSLTNDHSEAWCSTLSLQREEELKLDSEDLTSEQAASTSFVYFSITVVVKGLNWLVTNHRAVFCTMWRKWTNQKPGFGLLLRLWKISGPSQKWCDMGQGKDVTQEGPYGIWTHDLCDTDAALYPYVLPIRAWIFSRTGLNFYALSVRSTRTLHSGLISTNSLEVFITARIDSIFVF